MSKKSIFCTEKLCKKSPIVVGVKKYAKYQAVLALIFMALFCLQKNAQGGTEKISITEIMFDPEGSDTKREWIEIFNESGDALNLTGWKLFEGGSNHTLNFVSGSPIVESGKYAVIVDDINSFLEDYPAFDGMLIDSSFSLSNTGEEIILKNSGGEKESSVTYSALPESESGYSLELEDGNWRTSYKKFGTPGEKNSIKEVIDDSQTKKEYSNSIIITELFPNPFKSEYEEYIELFNGSEKDIDLAGWTLHDASKSGKFIFPENIIIKAKKYLAIFKKDFKFALNNSGNESVTLFDPNGKEISTSAYDGSKKNVSYNFNGTIWKWSKFLTPGSENVFNNEPYGKIMLPKEIYENVYADFSVSTGDKDGEKIKVVWDFGDKHKSYKEKTKHKYLKAGSYNGSLKISDSSEDMIQNFVIEVEEYPRPKVRIIEVNANPEGSDTKAETIIVENKSKKKINLKGWSIATGWKTFINHPIREDVIIAKNKSKEITRELSSFTLNNKQNKIELRYPDGKVASKVKYKKEDGIEEGEVYKKNSGGWSWIQSRKSVKSIKFVNTIKSEESEDEVSLVTESLATQSSEAEESSVISNQSSINFKKENKLIALSNEEIKIELLKISSNFPNNPEVREVDGKYLLTSANIEQEHYAIAFLKNISANANLRLSMLLNYFLK